MDEEHFRCPQCGYDLHGIPEVRCPECGFGFDHAALRTLGRSAEWGRLSVARAVIVRSVIGACVAACVVTYAFSGPGLVFLFICAAAFAVSLRVWAVIEGFERLKGPPVVWMAAFLMMALGGICLILVHSGLPLLIAAVMVSWGWRIRLREWPAFSAPDEKRLDAFRGVVTRHARWAEVTLGIGTAAVVRF
jgi:hypothetical protein